MDKPKLEDILKLYSKKDLWEQNQTKIKIIDNQKKQIQNLQEQLKEKEQEIERLKSCINILQKQYNKHETECENWKEKYFEYFDRCEQYETEIDELNLQLKTNTKQVCDRIRRTIFEYLKVNSIEELEKLSLLDSTLTYDVITDELERIEKGC